VIFILLINNETKTVLINGHSRAIYDTLGSKALETEGWAVVEKTKTPQEIREEYERLLQEREQIRLQQRTNPKGNITVGINATDLFEHYHLNELDGLYMPSIDITTMSISQSIDAPLTAYDTMTLSGNLSSHNGTGTGNISTALRHVISAKTWTEIEFAAGNGPLLTLKGFRTLSKTLHANAHVLFHYSPIGIRPGFNLGICSINIFLILYLNYKSMLFPLAEPLL
jgi:DnaJ homolog subfamily C member 11